MGEKQPRKRVDWGALDLAKLKSRLSKKAEAPRLTQKEKCLQELAPLVDALRKNRYSWRDIAEQFREMGMPEITSVAVRDAFQSWADDAGV